MYDVKPVAGCTSTSLCSRDHSSKLVCIYICLYFPDVSLGFWLLTSCESQISSSGMGRAEMYRFSSLIHLTDEFFVV